VTGEICELRKQDLLGTGDLLAHLNHRLDRSPLDDLLVTSIVPRMIVKFVTIGQATAEEASP
jgi:hypothetical protein